MVENEEKQEPLKVANNGRDESGRFMPGHKFAKGRPRNELSITNIQRQMLTEPCPYAEGKTWAQWLAKRGMELAGENPRYYCEIMDRLEGKVTQPIDAGIETTVKYTIGKGYDGNESANQSQDDS